MASASLPPALLSASPSSMHFSSFQLDQTYQQRVSIRNNSGKSLRLQFTFPGRNGASAAAFRVAFAGDANARKPFVSAGLTEELVVSFRAPMGFQYYYDCIRVKCEQVAYASNAPVALAGELLIPLHAYPVANTVHNFPTRIDFGAVPLGQIARREIPLSCSVPIEFEFAVELIKAHPSFTVFPLSGVIPANGSARVEIEFRPLAFSTASAELKLLVSQLGFEPVICTLVGSSSSTAGRGTNSISGANAGGDGASPGRADSKNGDGSDGGGASSSSPSKSLSPKRPTGASSTPSWKANGGTKDNATESSSTTEVVDGVEIPADINSVSGVTFILNQQAGKLRPRDLKKAIAASRELRQQQEALAADEDSNASDNQAGTLTFSALMRHEIEISNNNGADASDSEAQSSIGRMRFQREVKEVEALEKALEFQSHRQSRVGASLVSKEQAATLGEMRAMNALARAHDAREKMRSSFNTVAYGLDNQKAAQSGVKTATLPVEIAAGAAATVTPPPDFKPHKNDMWARRARVLQRLIRAVSTVMVRIRAQRRLDKIKRWLGTSATRADVRERVALDWKQARRGNNQLEYEEYDDTASACSSDRRLYLSSFPEVERREFRSRQRSPVATSDVGSELKRYAPSGFSSFFELRERDEALVMGHTALPLPPLPTYVPLFDVENAESDTNRDASSKQQRRTNGSRPVRTLRLGAFDEYGCAARSLSVAPVAADTTAPIASPVTPVSLLDMLPRDVFLRPQAAVRPLVIMDRDASVSLLNMRARESDPGYALRPKRGIKQPEARTFGERRALQMGMASVAAERRWRGQVRSDASDDAADGSEASSLFLSDVWLPTTTAKTMGTAVDPLFLYGDPPQETLSGSGHTGLSMFKDVWYVGIGRTDCGIPALATSAEDVPALSDSESDDDDEAGDGASGGQNTSSAAGDEAKPQRRHVPTWEDALRLFEPEGDAEPAGDSYGAGFERYNSLERQERAYCAARRELLDRLPNRLEPLAQRLAQIPGAPELVVEGHGPQRPLHQASGGAGVAVI